MTKDEWASPVDKKPHPRVHSPLLTIVPNYLHTFYAVLYPLNLNNGSSTADEPNTQVSIYSVIISIIIIIISITT